MSPDIFVPMVTIPRPSPSVGTMVAFHEMSLGILPLLVLPLSSSHWLVLGDPVSLLLPLDAGT